MKIPILALNQEVNTKYVYLNPKTYWIMDHEIQQLWSYTAKPLHCKKLHYSLCPFSHCSFNAFLTVIDCIQSITAIWIRCSQNLQSLQCDTCIFWILRSTFCALSASIFRGLYLNILHSNNCTFCNPIPAFFTSIKYNFYKLKAAIYAKFSCKKDSHRDKVCNSPEEGYF